MLSLPVLVCSRKQAYLVLNAFFLLRQHHSFLVFQVLSIHRRFSSCCVLQRGENRIAGFAMVWKWYVIAVNANDRSFQ